MAFCNFDDELLALLVFAVQVIHGFTVGFAPALLLGVEVGEVFDLLPVAEYLVQKINQQFLVELRAEQALETKIGEWIDVTFLYFHVLKIAHGINICLLLS